MPAGRPTLYSSEIAEKARQYLVEYEYVGDMIPSVAGLSVYLQVGRRTIYEWAEQEGKEEFSHILDDILSKQESVLLNKGLSGDFNPTITKLALGKHGYSEKTETELSGRNGGPIETVTKVELVAFDEDSED